MKNELGQSHKINSSMNQMSPWARFALLRVLYDEEMIINEWTSRITYINVFCIFAIVPPAHMHTRHNILHHQSFCNLFYDGIKTLQSSAGNLKKKKKT